MVTTVRKTWKRAVWLLAAAALLAIYPAGAVAEAETAVSIELKNAAQLMSRRSADATFLAELAAAWSSMDRQRAGAILGKAFETTFLVLDEEALTKATAATTGASFQPPRARDLITRRAAAVRREARSIQALLATARSWRSFDPDRAEVVLEEAVRRVRLRENLNDRDLGLRAAAVEWAETDASTALSLAGTIESPEIRSWACRAIGLRLAANDRPAADKAFGLALEAVIRVKDPLLRVVAMADLGRDWFQVDPSAGRMAFTDAVRATALIGDEAAYARALSAAGGRWGRTDAGKAFELAGMIPAGYDEARISLFLEAAEGPWDSKTESALLEAAWRAAEEIGATFRRDRRLGSIAARMAEVDPNAALRMIDLIRPEARLHKSEALAAVVRAIAAEQPEFARELTAGIDDEFVKVRAISAIVRTNGDPNRALPLDPTGMLDRLGPAGDGLRAEYAPALTGFGNEGGEALIAAIRDPAIRAKALADLALRKRKRGSHDEASRLLDEAIKTAERLGLQNRALGAKVVFDIAKAWADDDPNLAEKMYESAYQLRVGQDNGA
jgi:hypothetical protein